MQSFSSKEFNLNRIQLKNALGNNESFHFGAKKGPLQCYALRPFKIF